MLVQGSRIERLPACEAFDAAAVVRLAVRCHHLKQNRGDHCTRGQPLVQCDQIGRFLIVLGDMVSIKSSPNTW